MKYNKGYIGIKRSNRVDNFVYFIPKKKYVKIIFKENPVLNKLIKDPECKKDFQKIRNNRIRLKIDSKEDLEKNIQIIEQIFKVSGGTKNKNEV